MYRGQGAGEVAGGERHTARAEFGARARGGHQPAGQAAKRIFDVAVSACALVLLGVPILALAILIRIKLGGPVLFRQVRPGLRGKPFELVKFRTMTDERGADGELLPDADRLTSFGKFLRSSSLDELPELWNVLKGNMSIVGPRPLLMEYLPLYTKMQSRRHDIRPGITGWAQVNGRNCVDWDDRLRMDVWYVDHRSMWLDLKIICRTFHCVLARKDINAPGEATMSRFSGSTQ